MEKEKEIARGREGTMDWLELEVDTSKRAFRPLDHVR